MNQKKFTQKKKSNRQIKNPCEEEYYQLLCTKENYCTRCKKLKPDYNRSSNYKDSPRNSLNHNSNNHERSYNSLNKAKPKRVSSPTYVACASYFDASRRDTYTNNSSTISEQKPIIAHSRGVSSSANASTCCCVDEPEWSDTDDDIECCCDENRNCKCFVDEPNKIKRRRESTKRDSTPSRDEYMRNEFRCDEFERDEMRREGSIRDEMRREGSIRDEMRREGSIRDEMRREGSIRDEPRYGEAVRDGLGRGESVRDQYRRREFSRDDSKSEEGLREDRKSGEFMRDEFSRERYNRNEPRSEEFNCSCDDSRSDEQIIPTPYRDIKENSNTPNRSVSSLRTNPNNLTCVPMAKSFYSSAPKSSCRPGLCPPIRCPFCHMTKKETKDKCNNTKIKKKCCCFRRKKCY